MWDANKKLLFFLQLPVRGLLIRKTRNWKAAGEEMRRSG